MSALANRLAEVEIPKLVKTPKTPCFPLYGYGDSDDLAAVNRLRDAGAEWSQVQQSVDSALDVKEPLELSKFIRHWRAQCSCWSGR